MNKEELIKRIADLEWEDFEVKEAKASIPKSTWETVSAFSNTAGGWLVFGIKQNGNKFEIQGLDNPEKIEQDLLSVLNGKEKFNTIIPTKQAKYDIDGKTILAFYIPVAKEKPVYYNSLANTFIRRGSSDNKASKAEIDAMYRDQSFGTKTSEIAIGTSRADIDDISLRQYRDYMSRFNPDVSYNRYDEEKFLKKLRIIDEEQCTYGGLLFLGKRDKIEKFFPDFRIDLLEIPGNSISDAKTHYTFRLDEHENLWDYYFECFKRLKNKVDVEFILNEQGFGQELSPGLKAIREALVNMLMHADYFSPAHSRIRVFYNHIEFFNPGGLPKPLEELKRKDLSLPRNPIITKLFRMVKLAENAGFGFDKIDTNWKEYNGTDAEYDIAFDSTIIKLNLKAEEEKIDTSDKLRNKYGEISDKLRKELFAKETDSNKILSELRGNYGVFTGYLRGKNQFDLESLQGKYNERIIFAIILIDIYPEITKQKIADALGKSLSTIEKDFKILRNDNIIEHIGSDKTGYWIINK
jgi:ATP-dependent DNA helicase RecG